MNTMFRFSAVAGLVMAAATASAAFVINELDADTPGTDVAEFVELKGNPNESAAGLVLVVFNGNPSSTNIPKVKSATDLGTYSADSNGYLIIGNSGVAGVDIVKASNFLENSEEAVALYTGRAVSEFPTTAGPTSAGLVDVVIYKANSDGPNDWTGFGLPSVTVVSEAEVGVQTWCSVGRLPNGTGSLTYLTPSPNAANFQRPGEIAATAAVNVPRVNQFTPPTPTTVTLRNMGVLPCAVNTIAVDPQSSTVFSLSEAPALPVVLAPNLTMTAVVQMHATDVTVNAVYGGTMTYTSDSPVTPSGTIPLSGELVRATQTAAAGAVKINEILYYPDADWNGDGEVLNQYDEFVELYNTTASPILIEGWEQRAIDGDDLLRGNRFVFPIGATIQPNSFVVVFSGGTPTGFAAGTVFTYFPNNARLRNDPHGAYLSLKDGANNVVDAIAYLASQDSPDVDGYLNTRIDTATRGSYGRSPDGANGFAFYAPTGSALPTPGAPNSPTAAADWNLFE